MTIAGGNLDTTGGELLTVGNAVVEEKIVIRGDFSEKYVLNLENPPSSKAMVEVEDP